MPRARNVRPSAAAPTEESPARWPRSAKVAFIGSHGIRKTSAVLAFAATVQRAGCSAELAREVVRDNPLGINKGAAGKAQLWVLVSQSQQELELARKADVLATDRGVMDNFAYYLRACGGTDRYAVEALVRSWSRTYDLVVRLLPDIELQPDGVRSTTTRSATRWRRSWTACFPPSWRPNTSSRSAPVGGDQPLRLVGAPVAAGGVGRRLGPPTHDLDVAASRSGHPN